MKSTLPFLRQIEEALATCLVVPCNYESYGGFYRRVMDLLAPQVAAAIELAATDWGDSEMIKQRALAILKGGEVKRSSGNAIVGTSRAREVEQLQQRIRELEARLDETPEQGAFVRAAQAQQIAALTPPQLTEQDFEDAWDAYCANLEQVADLSPDQKCLTAPQFLWRWFADRPLSQKGGRR